MNASTIGIDLVKNVFQVHVANAQGMTVFTKRLSRKQFLPFPAKLPPCLVDIKVCSGANYWARRLRELGHEVCQMSPQFVKPYIKTNKNDYNDAQAICEAVARPDMRFVPSKTIEQQDLQALHRVRTGQASCSSPQQTSQGPDRTGQTASHVRAMWRGSRKGALSRKQSRGEPRRV